MSESVDSLENVDLSSLRPVGTVGPERRPRPAARRHVNGVEDDETSVEDVLGVKSNGLSTSNAVSDLGGLVDGDDGVSLRVDSDETLGPLEKKVRRRGRGSATRNKRARDERERERKVKRTEVAASW